MISIWLLKPEFKGFSLRAREESIRVEGSIRIPRILKNQIKNNNCQPVKNLNLLIPHDKTF